MVSRTKMWRMFFFNLKLSTEQIFLPLFLVENLSHTEKTILKMKEKKTIWFYLETLSSSQKMTGNTKTENQRIIQFFSVIVDEEPDCSQYFLSIFDRTNT